MPACLALQRADMRPETDKLQCEPSTSMTSKALGFMGHCYTSDTAKPRTMQA